MPAKANDINDLVDMIDDSVVENRSRHFPDESVKARKRAGAPHL